MSHRFLSIRFFPRNWCKRGHLVGTTWGGSSLIRELRKKYTRAAHRRQQFFEFSVSEGRKQRTKRKMGRGRVSHFSSPVFIFVKPWSKVASSRNFFVRTPTNATVASHLDRNPAPRVELEIGRSKPSRLFTSTEQPTQLESLIGIQSFPCDA